jgi:hypothetical protein
MAKGMGGGMDFPPGSGKGIASVSQDGIEDASGAGGKAATSETGAQSERVAQIAQRFADGWSQSRAAHEGFLSGKIAAPLFQQNMEESATELARLREEIAKSSKDAPGYAELKALADTANKAFTRYIKFGTALNGQQVREDPTIFGDIDTATTTLLARASTAHEAVQDAPVSDTEQAPVTSQEKERAGTRRGTSAGVEKELPRQRGKKKPGASEVPVAEVAEIPETGGETTAPGSVVEEAAPEPVKKKGLFGNKKPKEAPVYPEDSFEGQRLAAREVLKSSPVVTEGESLGDASDRVLEELKNRPPEPEDAPIIRTTTNTPASEIFGTASVDPLSPDVIPAEVGNELRRQIAGEQERLAAEGITTGEPPKPKRETAKEVKERLARRAGGEKANAEYLQKDAELGAAELERKNAYFAALKKFQNERTMGDVLSERLGFKSGDTVEVPKELKALKKEWVQSTQTRAKSRLDSVLARREGRGGDERQARDAEAVLKRFERRYVLREAVFKTAEEEASVRARALGERDSNIVEKTANGFANHPLVQKYGSKALLGLTTVSVGAGVVGAGFALTAGTVMAAPMAVILAGSVASAGFRIRAEMLKDKAQALKEKVEGATGEDKRNILAEIRKAQASQEKAQKWASRLTLSGWAGGVTKWFTKDVVQRGTRDAATLKDELGNVGGAVQVDWNSQEAFEQLRADIDAATARVRQADVHLGYATTVGSVAGGAALGAGVGYIHAHTDDVMRAVSPVVDAGIDKAGDAFGSAKDWVGDHLPGHHSADTASTDASGAVDKDAPAGGGGAGNTEAAATDARAPSATDANADTNDAAATRNTETKAEAAAADTAKAGDAAPVAKADAAPAAPVSKVEAAPTTPDGLMAGVEVKPGQGFGEMIVSLRGKIPDDIQNPSPALEHVLNSNANALTHELEVAMDGKSLVMQPGDKFFVDNDQNIWFQQVGDKHPHLAFENVTPSPEHPDGYVAHPIDGKMIADPVLPAPKAAAESGPAAPSTASDVVIIQGNEDITVGDVTITQGGVGGSLTMGEQPIEGITVDQNVQLEPGLKAPENLDTTVPTTDAQAPAEAPKADAPAAPAPEVQAPKLEVVGTAHPFADPSAGPDINPNGVDLNKPQILVNEGRAWALGTGNEDSYNRAVAQSLELAKTPGAETTNVYFVVKEVNPDTNQPYLAVRMVYTPPNSETPLMAPFGPGSKPVADLPDANKFTLPPKR